MADYYTNTWDLMASIKRNLMKFADSSDSVTLKKIKTWNIGFVFPATIFPAITVFPLTKIFLPVRSNGLQIVEYRFSVDVYSEKRIKLEDSKRFILNASDDVVKAIKKYGKMPDSVGMLHSFSTEILGTNIQENRENTQRGFSSTVSMEIQCRAYHQMDIDRKHRPTIIEATYDEFFNKVTFLFKAQFIERGLDIKDYMPKVARPVTKSPAVAVLPGREQIDQTLSGQMAIMNRPVEFHVLTRGIHRPEIIKRNIVLADKIVTLVEREYMLEGYSQNCAVQSIDYLPNDDATLFNSVIEVIYSSRNKLSFAY